MKKAAAAALLLFLLSGCATSAGPGNKTNVLGSVDRVVDVEAGVACWIYAGRAISCLPLQDTQLER